jgi:hypothetical protein
MLQALFAVLVRVTPPYMTRSAVPLFAGTDAGLQFCAVLQRLFAPPPFHVQVAANVVADPRAKYNAAPTINRLMFSSFFK